jgi:myosin heavy subunit
MAEINRMLMLAGMNPKRVLISELKAARDELNNAHDQLIRQIETGAQIDEGLFSALKAALQTAGQVGTASAKAAVEKARKLAEPVKQMYLDNKARDELKSMTKALGDVVNTFQKIEDDSKTILSRDKEVAAEIKLFKDLLLKTIETLAARLQVQNEGLQDEDIRDLMIEHGYLVDDSAEDLLEAKLDNAVLQQVKDSQEFKDLTAEFKLVSTKRELDNGTLVFDIGVPGINFKGEEIKGTKFVLKAYADGQLRGQLRGVLKDYAVSDGRDGRHFRIGKKFVSQTGDQVVLYRAMLKDILARGKKKVANQPKVIAAQKEAYKEYINRYYGPDSIPDDGNEGW